MVQAAEVIPATKKGGSSTHRRRRLLTTLIVVGLLLAAFGIFAVSFVASYQPLQADPGGAPSGVTGNVQNLGSYLPPGNADPTDFVAYLAPPTKTTDSSTSAFTIENREYFPVTVEEVGGLGGAPLRQISVRIGSGSDFGTSPPSQPATHPFRPF